jgi:hypothetical protein
VIHRTFAQISCPTSGALLLIRIKLDETGTDGEALHLTFVFGAELLRDNDAQFLKFVLIAIFCNKNLGEIGFAVTPWTCGNVGCWP